MAIQNISFITRAKAESLNTLLPSSYVKVLSSSEAARFILISKESGFSTYFILAISEGDELVWISDSDYRASAEEFLKANN